MDAEEVERSAAQVAYDQAQRDYSTQVLGDRAHGLPEEPPIGSIGPLPTQRFAQQFLAAAGIKLTNMTGPCTQESGGTSEWYLDGMDTCSSGSHKLSHAHNHPSAHMSQLK